MISALSTVNMSFKKVQGCLNRAFINTSLLLLMHEIFEPVQLFVWSSSWSLHVQGVLQTAKCQEYPCYFIFTTPFNLNHLKTLWVEGILELLRNKPQVLKSGKGWSIRSCCFFIPQRSGAFLQHNNVCSSAHWPWIRVASKGNFCQTPALWDSQRAISVCFFFKSLAQRWRFNSSIITGYVVLYSTSCKFWDSGIFFLVALYSSNWIWTETTADIKVLFSALRSIKDTHCSPWL